MGYGSRGVVLNTISERKYVLIDERSESEQQKAGLFKNDIHLKDPLSSLVTFVQNVSNF
jgi:hypothetical protein